MVGNKYTKTANLQYYTNNSHVSFQERFGSPHHATIAKILYLTTIYYIQLGQIE